MSSTLVRGLPQTNSVRRSRSIDRGAIALRLSGRAACEPLAVRVRSVVLSAQGGTERRHRIYIYIYIYTLIARAFDQANALQRFLRQFAASGPGSWLFARILHRIDVPVYRASRGRLTVAGALAGLPIVVLTTIGARSGLPRNVPLLGLPTSEGLVVIGSNYGQPHAPAWVHNLRADPEVIASVCGRRAAMHAVLAEGERRARIWDDGLRIYPGFGQYERRAAQRTITVWVLEPTRSPVHE